MIVSGVVVSCMRMRGMLMIMVMVVIVLIATTVRLDMLLTQSKFPYRLASGAGLNVPTRDSAMSIQSNAAALSQFAQQRGDGD